MRILITGCRGQLGTELRRQLQRGYGEIGFIPEALKNADITAVSHDDLDIADLQSTMKFVRRCRPDVILNCAACTNVDGCETDRDTAFRANALGPRNLAMAAESIGARLVHVSTDYVFPGTPNGGRPLDESAVPSPLSAYGSTKLLGEQYVRQFCSRSFIVRTAWLYSYYGKNFVKTIVSAGKKYGRLNVVNDQWGNPTSAADLAHVLLRLAVSDEYGLYHCTGEGVCSWFDFASEIIRLSGVEAVVHPCTTAEYKAMNPASTDRPAWSALDNRMLRCTIGDPVRPWQEALQCFFEHWDGGDGRKEESFH